VEPALKGAEENGAPPQGGLAHLTGSPGPGRRRGREGRAREPPGDCPTLGGWKTGKSAKVPEGTGRGRRLKGLRAFKP